MKIFNVSMICLIILGFSTIYCKSPKNNSATFNEDGKMILEAEAFKIDSAEIKKYKKASGGKGVLFSKEKESKVTFIVKIPKGNYRLVVYEMAPGKDQDAIYVSINEDEPFKTFNNIEHGTFGPCLKEAKFSIEKKQKVTIIVFAKEIGMVIDKIEIIKL